MSDAPKGHVLLALARGAIAEQFGLSSPLPDTSEDWLQQPGATFVTLTQDGRLRGCIGSLEAHRPLWQDVGANAVHAALHDPRFAPLTEEELSHTRVEVSLLSAQQPMQFSSEADALAQLRPGMDGVVLEHGRDRGTFLPQVWEQLPTREEFMAHLKLKAGLPAQFWDDAIRLSRYTVDKWKEPAPASLQPEE